MATEGTQIKRENFSTTPYHYQTSSLPDKTVYYFFKSNVCWDVYIWSYARCYISFDFYDYTIGSWIPYTSNSYTHQDTGESFQYRIERQVLRFFHNSNAHWDDAAYTADIKIRDIQNLSYGGHTYDTRGFSLWRIKLLTINTGIGFDFNINSFGAGQLTSQEYEDVCYGKQICCGGKGDPNSDDQHITTSASDYATRFLPSLFTDKKKITSNLDRQCIPYWGSFKT